MERIENTKSNKGKRVKKIAIIVGSILVACIAFVTFLYLIVIPNYQYYHALELIKGDNQDAAYVTLLQSDEDKEAKQREAKLKEAQAIFTELGDFKDSKQLLENFKWVKARDIFDSYNTEYNYDLCGNCIKKIEIFPNGDQHVTEYSYDGEGKCIREVQPDAYEGTRIIDYIYDEQGRCIKESNGSYVYANYTYDEQGNCVEASGWEWSVDYIYNEQGKCVREEHYGEGYRSVVDYIYDENGNVVKKVEEEGLPGMSKNISVTEYFYDENENCNIETTQTDKSYLESVVKHEYQFIYAAKE